MLGNIFNDIIDMDKFDCCKLEFFFVVFNFEEFVVEIEVLVVLMVE